MTTISVKNFGNVTDKGCCKISVKVSANDNNPTKVEEVAERGCSRNSQENVSEIIVNSLRKIIDKLLTAV